MELSKAEMWLAFLDHTDEELVKYACEHNEAIKKAEEEFQRIIHDDDFMEELLKNEEENSNNDEE